MTWNIGSVVAEVGKRLDDIPTGISGTGMNSIVIEEIIFAQREGHVTIGSVDIPETYHGILTKLVMSNVQGVIKMQGADVSSIKVGEFAVSKGQALVKKEDIEILREQAVDELRQIRGKHHSYKAWGV